MTKYKDYNTADPRLSNFDTWYRANAGLIDDLRTVHKFGRAIVGTTLTPLCFGGFYRMPGSPVSLEVLSDSIEDAPGGTGGYSFKVLGLNNNWEEAEQTVTLDGTTPVPIPGTWLRNYRNRCSESNVYADQSTPSHAGTITLREAGGGDTWAIMDGTGDIPKSASEIGAYTVQAGEVGFIETKFINVDSTKTARVELYQRPNADIVAVPFSTLQQAFTIGAFVGSVSITTKKGPIGPFTGPCDIVYFGAVTQTTGEIDVDFEISLFKFS